MTLAILALLAFMAVMLWKPAPVLKQMLEDRALARSAELNLAERRVVVEERLAELKEREITKPAPPKPDPPPADLMQEALRESETWAQEQSIARLYELYDTLGKWELVRAVVTREGMSG